MLSGVAAADLGHDVVLVLAGDDKDVLGAVAVDGGSQVEGEQVDSVLADAFVVLADPHAAHPLLTIGQREAGVAKVEEAFGGKVSTTDLDCDFSAQKVRECRHQISTLFPDERSSRFIRCFPSHTHTNNRLILWN